jgi:hypothetical protein
MGVQVLLGLVTACLAFLGAFVSQRLDYRRWHREETMRLLRWGVERSTAGDEMASQSGLVVLRALLSAQLLQREDELFAERVVAAVARLRSANYPESAQLELAGGDDE